MEAEGGVDLEDPSLFWMTLEDLLKNGEEVTASLYRENFRGVGGRFALVSSSWSLPLKGAVASSAAGTTQVFELLVFDRTELLLCLMQRDAEARTAVVSPRSFSEGRAGAVRGTSTSHLDVREGGDMLDLGYGLFRVTDDGRLLFIESLCRDDKTNIKRPLLSGVFMSFVRGSGRGRVGTMTMSGERTRRVGRPLAQWEGEGSLLKVDYLFT